MALTRKFLRALGIEDDKIGEIIDAHTETVDALKDERDRFKTAAESADGLRAELDAAKNQLAQADSDGFKAKYEQEHADFEAFRQSVDADKANAAKAAAYRGLLDSIGIRGKLADTIIGGADMATVEMDGDKIKGAAELEQQIRADWRDYIPETRTQGAHVQNPPQNGGGMTRDQILQIKDSAERQKAIAEHLELFGKNGG